MNNIAEWIIFAVIITVIVSAVSVSVSACVASAATKFIWQQIHEELQANFPERRGKLGQVGGGTL